MVVYIRVRKDGVPWRYANPNADKWVKKFDVVQFHISNGKIYLFYNNGESMFFRLSQLVRVAVEDDNIVREKTE